MSRDWFPVLGIPWILLRLYVYRVRDLTRPATSLGPEDLRIVLMDCEYAVPEELNPGCRKGNWIKVKDCSPVKAL